MLRYFSKIRSRTKSGVRHRLPDDLWVEFNWYGGVEVLHKITPPAPAHQSWLKETVVCRHKLAAPKSRQELQEFFKRVRPRFQYEYEWADLRKEFTSSYYAPRPKEWEEALPEKVAIWASRRLGQLKDKHGDSCTDNYRAARVGSTCGEKRYRRQVKSGCCGFFDTVEVCPVDGKAHRLGFNYGH